MIDKKSKIAFFNFLPFECGAVEEYLENMAEKGWRLQSIRGVFFQFKKIEPQKLKYSVDVFNKISGFDHKDSDLAMEYREYCKAAGWKYLCEKGKVQVFYSENHNNIISIHTDEKEKFKSVFRASLQNLIGQIILMLMFIFNLYMQLFMGNASFNLANNLGILSIVAMGSFIFIATIETFSFILWTIRAKINLKNNKSMHYNTYKQIQLKNIFKYIYVSLLLIIFLKVLIFDNKFTGISGAIMLLSMAILVIVPMLIKGFLDKERYSKTTNAIITLSSVVVLLYITMMLISGGIILGLLEPKDNLVPLEKVELTLRDFGYIEKTNIEAQGSFNKNPYISAEGSILAKIMDYSASGDSSELSYTIFQSEYPLIINFAEDRLIQRLRGYGINLKQVDTKLPSGVRVYSEENKRKYVVVSKNKVLEVRKDFVDFEEDKFLEIIYKALFKK